MPDRATQDRHLEEAERHIVRGLELMSDVRLAIERAEPGGANVGAASRTLAVMAEVMVSFEAHRDLIKRTLAEIDAGKL